MACLAGELYRTYLPVKRIIIIIVIIIIIDMSVPAD